jgi:hypothetical protein
MRIDTLDYLRMRERAERAAALNASCEQVRAVHEEMAGAYARLVRREEGGEDHRSPDADGAPLSAAAAQVDPIHIR